ncbi:34_t:CDS:2 [Gigaspora rosea]|nr:34_t:CDS:2 [Gigaspora rosea]
MVQGERSNIAVQTQRSSNVALPSIEFKEPEDLNFREPEDLVISGLFQ